MTLIVLNLLVDKWQSININTLILNLTKSQLDLQVLLKIIFFFRFFIVLVSQVPYIVKPSVYVIKLNSLELDLNLLLSHLLIESI